MSNLPPDRSRVLTEQRNPRSMNLHELSVDQLTRLMNDEDELALKAVRQAQPAIVQFIEALEPRFSKGGRLIYIGAGTSGRLGVLDASEIPPTFQLEPDRIIGIIAGGDSALRESSEGMEDDPDGALDELTRLSLRPNDALLGIAAGSTTPYVVGALRIAKTIEPKMLTGFLTCSQSESNLPADHIIFLDTGPELVTGSTRMKAGTATKLTLNMITTTLMIRSGRVYQNLMVDLKATNNKLRDRAARIIGTLTGLNRGACFDLLDRAKGRVKVALVMQIKGVEVDEAERLLDRLEGRIDRVIRG